MDSLVFERLFKVEASQEASSSLTPTTHVGEPSENGFLIQKNVVSKSIADSRGQTISKRVRPKAAHA